MDRVINKVVQKRINKVREGLDTIKRRKLEYFTQVIRNPKYELLYKFIQVKIESAWPWLSKNILTPEYSQWYKVKTTTLFKSAANKVKIMRLIANVLKRQHIILPKIFNKKPPQQLLEMFIRYRRIKFSKHEWLTQMFFNHKWLSYWIYYPKTNCKKIG